MVGPLNVIYNFETASKDSLFDEAVGAAENV